MRQQLKIRSTYAVASALACIVAMQATNINLGELKLSEIALLFFIFICPLIYKLKIPRPILLVFGGFFILLLASLIVTASIEIYPISNTSILKSPFVLSISKFVLLIGCASFGWFVIKQVQKYPIVFEKAIYGTSTIFATMAIFMWLLGYLGIENFSVYGSELRLRWTFVEGGPVGLMFAYFMYIFFRRKNLGIAGALVFGICIYLSKSKAAYLFLLIMMAWTLYKSTKRYKRYTLVAIAMVIMIPIANLLLDQYVEAYSTINQKILGNESDTSLVMGRIAASHIAPKIISDNLFFGVGLGNYSLVRNNPDYLGILPAVDDWDLTGLGGLLTLLVENGIFGIFMYFFILASLLRMAGKSSLAVDFTVAHLAALTCGVQLYFCYIWYGIAIANSKIS